MGVLAVRLPTGTDVSDEDLTEIAASVARSIRLADTATDIYRVPGARGSRANQPT